MCPGMARSPRSLPGLSPRPAPKLPPALEQPPGNALLFPKGTVPRGTAQAHPEPLWAWHRESCPFPTHLLGLHQPFWQLPGSSSTSRAVGESLPQPNCPLPWHLPPQPFPTARGPTARPPHTPTGHMGHRSCSAAAARELGNGSRPRSTEGSQELPNQSFLPLLGFTCSWAGADAGLGLCLK